MSSDIMSKRLEFCTKLTVIGLCFADTCAKFMKHIFCIISRSMRSSSRMAEPSAISGIAMTKNMRVAYAATKQLWTVRCLAMYMPPAPNNRVITMYATVIEAVDFLMPLNRYLSVLHRLCVTNAMPDSTSRKVKNRSVEFIKIM